MKPAFLALCFSVLYCLNSFCQDRVYCGEFKSVIRQALAEGKKHIEIKRGTWYMDLKDGLPLLLENLKDIEIIGNGAEIICNRPARAIEIKNCERLRISDLSIDYDPLPFTEGKIVAVDTARHMWMDVEIYQGYRTDMIEGHQPDRLQVFNGQTNCLRENLYTYFAASFTKAKKKGDRLFRFSKSSYNQDACEAVNDNVVFSLPYAGNVLMHTVMLSGSADIHLSNITLYAGNCFGFFETGCQRNIYDHCKVTLKENDQRYAYPRLRSNNADAFHSKHALYGPAVTNCTFLYHGDDGIAINTDFYSVIGGDGKAVYIEGDAGLIKIKAGHQVRFIDSLGKITGVAKVLKVQSMTVMSGSGGGKIFETSQASFRQSRTAAQLLVDKPVTLSSGTVVSSLTAAGNGFCIKNNTIGNTRARAILVKASDGIIENNIVKNCELGGIVLAPELSWMEAGFSSNVLIKNNIVRHCMFANSSYGIEQAAPISVVAINRSGTFAPPGGFNAVRIVGNIIEDTPLPAIMMTSAKDCIIDSNKIITGKKMIRTHGRRFGVDNTQPIWIKNVCNIKVVSNSVQ